MKSAGISKRQDQHVITAYLKDKAARLFNSAVAMFFLVMAQNGMAWHFQGVVWNDTNQDGIHQAGEIGVSNITVKVLNCTNDALVFSTKTASDGSFSVTDSQIPLNGNYQVCFTNLPAGYVFTKQIYPPPTNGTIVSTADPVTGCAPCFIFDQLTNSTLNNAGIYHATATTATALTSLTECPGNTAVFSTVASGTGPFSYAWRFNGSVLSRKTTNSLTIPSVSSTNAGTYSVVVSGKLNSVTNSATLTVSTNTTATSLTSQTVCSGSPATFATTASGTGPFTYVWRLNGVQLSSQTTHSITIASVTSTNAGAYSVEVYGSCNSVTNTAALTVSIGTTATTLGNQAACPGSPVTFATTPSGTGPFAYVWRLNGAQLTGQTTNSLKIPSVSATNTGTYSVEVYGSCNSVTNSAKLTVSTNTTATSLASQTVCPGSPVTFATIASGTGPFSYVWRLNGAQLTGQTTNSLDIVSAGSTNAGNYSVEVYGSCNSVTNSATLTLDITTAATPLSGLTLCPGNLAIFTTKAFGTGPFSYVWRLNGAQLAGQTTNSLVIPSVASTNAGVYSVEVYGGCGSVTNTATLTVSTNTTATALTSQTVCSGTAAAFATIASGTGPFNYIWRLNGAQLPGQTTNSLSIPSAGPTNAGTYSVEVYGSCNSVTNTATLAISTNTTATPLTSQTVCLGSPAMFATVASGAGPFSYVWRLNGSQLIGQTTNSLDIPSVGSTNTGNYTVEVYGSCNSVTNAATLAISTNTTATPLANQLVCLGSPANFATVASGAGPFTYIWRLNGGQLIGQTTNSLSIASVGPTNAGTYAVEVYGGCNSVTNTATLAISTNTTATPLTSQTVCPGGAATFASIASGTGPFSYIWRLNGAQLVGQITNSLSISSVGPTNAGNYSVEVYGSCNSVTNTATLTVSTNTTATALTSLTLCPGSPAMFTTTASGTGPFSYVWRFNGGQLTGQTTNSLSIASVNATNAGSYSVEVYGSCNSVTNSATLTVNAATTATPLKDLTVCPGSPATFTSTASGTGPFSYIWRFNGAQLIGQTTNTIQVLSAGPTNAGIYSVEVYGSCNSVTNSATLMVSTNVVATPLTSLVVCPGSPALFATTPSGSGPFLYVWRLNGAQLTGQTTNSLSIPSVSSSNAGAYSVEVHGSCDSVTNSATLTVSTNTTATPLASLTVCPGSPASFFTIASGTGPFSYVWRLNGAQLIGKTTNSLSILSASSANAGAYTVEVYGNCNSVTNGASLTVSTNTTTTALTSQTVCPGSPASFATIASGTGPFVYVWRLNGVQLVGQTTNSLDILSVGSTNAGAYTVEIYGNCNSVTNAATLTVSTNVTATALTSQTVCPGNAVAFATIASGTGPFAYVWRLNGAQLITQTTNSLNISSASSTNAGVYTVEIYGSCGSATNSATLTVNSSTTATPLTSLLKVVGTSAMFSTTASGTGPFTYVWRLNGTRLAGQTNSSLTIPSVSSTNAGVYAVEVYGDCNSVTNTATLTLAVPPTVTILSPTNNSTFIALADITVLAQVEDLDSTISNVEFFAITNASGVTNVPGISTIIAATNKIGQTTSGPPYFILWTNVTPGVYYLAARGTDALGAVGISQIVTVKVLDQPPVVQIGQIQFDPQIDDFVQTVSVTNPTYYTYDSVRLLIGNLPTGTQVVNASGMTNGQPFVQSLLPIAPGGSVTFTIDYYVPFRIPPSNIVFTVQLAAPLNAVNQVGPMQHINGGLMLQDKTFLVEFKTLPNRVYYLQYSADLLNWSTANPAIVGTGGVYDWIDSGPPETPTLPSAQSRRFYRVILLP